MLPNMSSLEINNAWCDAPHVNSLSRDNTHDIGAFGDKVVQKATTLVRGLNPVTAIFNKKEFVYCVVPGEEYATKVLCIAPRVRVRDSFDSDSGPPAKQISFGKLYVPRSFRNGRPIQVRTAILDVEEILIQRYSTTTAGNATAMSEVLRISFITRTRSLDGEETKDPQATVVPWAYVELRPRPFDGNDFKEACSNAKPPVADETAPSFRKKVLSKLSSDSSCKAKMRKWASDGHNYDFKLGFDTYERVFPLNTVHGKEYEWQSGQAPDMHMDDDLYYSMMAAIWQGLSSTQEESSVFLCGNKDIVKPLQPSDLWGILFLNATAVRP